MPLEVEARLAETKYFKQVKKLVKEDTFTALLIND